MRIIVETIDDMPGKARDGLPLGCVLETDGPKVVAFSQGSTFSNEGLRLITSPLMTFVAHFDIDCDEEPVEVRAKDIRAALQWLQRHFCGLCRVYVKAATIYLGEFRCDSVEDHS